MNLEKGKVLWLRFDGDRTEQGYRNVRVSDEPLRTDAAIVATLAVLEATAVNKKNLNSEIRRLGALLHAHSDTPLEGPLTERVTEVAYSWARAKPEIETCSSSRRIYTSASMSSCWRFCETAGQGSMSSP